MNPFGAQLLNVITYLPAVGAVLILLLFRKDQNRLVVRFATVVAGSGFLVSLPLWFGWRDAAPDAWGFRFVQQADWIDSLGVRYIVGVDGISMLLVLLTTLLGFVAILSAWNAVRVRVREFYAAMLLLQTGMIGVFVSLDFFLFYVFWEVMLVPMYFIIGVWGGSRKIYAAVKFFIYTLLGSLLMLIGIVAVYLYHGQQTGMYTFDIRYLQAMGMWADWFELQYWVWLAFFVGFAIKVPMFPFHTWLPDAHVEAPTAGSVILAGVLLKMGTYGFLRFSLPMMPEATRHFLPWALGLSIVGVIYGAMVALMQKDWKKLVAYSSVSHLGLTMVGVFALNHQGLTGGVLQMINHGLSTGALFLIVGLVYERRHTREIAEYGGLWRVMPVFAVLFMIAMLSSIGMPLIPGNGFVGEFTVLIGVFQLPQKIWAVLAASGIVLGAVYMLWLYQRTIFGPLDRDENRKLLDLDLREIATLVPLTLIAFWIGVYPKPFFNVLDEPVRRLVQQVEGQYRYPPEVVSLRPESFEERDARLASIPGPAGKRLTSTADRRPIWPRRHRRRHRLRSARQT
ncbi:MAG TPA: NADH-quinone oxidoreductase subunit M [Candidatus Polarisedimenticolaceae bacterium]|nr:NADH-quinone oxidoreductase subunit M [Candidatus Polarisedimenticolaceae bacterium]